jgi:pyruvate dehydrogenase (quinone)
LEDPLVPETASDLLVDRLIAWGVDTVFGLPGDGINGFMEALRTRQDRIRYTHTRHEETAALAACAYAKFTGRLGVCFATAGPGAVHLLNGLYDARMDQAPVLAITGMTYHDLTGTSYLQDINTEYFVNDVAYHNQRIMGPAHVEEMVDVACRTALSLRGPAHLAFPIDYQTMQVSEQHRYKRNVPGHTGTSFAPPVRIPESSLLERAAEVFKGKQRVAILAGAGARGAGMELEQVAEKLGAPIVKAMLGKDCIPDDNPYVAGGIGVVGTRPSQMAMKSCDALLIVGSTMPYIEFYPSPGQAECVQIDDKPERIGLRHPATVGLPGDARATLRALLPLLPRIEDRSFLQQIQKEIGAWWELMEERGTRRDTPMKPQVVTWELGRLLDEDAVICGDSGTVTTWQARMKLRAQQRFSFSGTMCSMMAALPYAIGAQRAFPGRQVVAFTGDGSLTMMLGELATLAQEKLPVKVIVVKNDVLGLIRWEQQVFLGNPEYGVDFHPVDFVKVAEGCGLPAVRIEDPKKCGDALKQALRMDGPALIEAVVDPFEPPLPAMITREQAKKLWQALKNGEEHRIRIGLTIGRDLIDESTFEASPYGLVGRAQEKLSEVLHRGDQ